MLRDLQTYLQRQRRASLHEIEQHFHTDADALRGMLNQLIRKGRVHKTEGSKCSHCCQCAPEAIEFYEWTN
ncbi:FeoC-like transcriptional regulator [Leptolyngbya sp. AN02str]|uniref:FeoC-like transcriptional regulator n=1 Tax=Leptolyngbya sp. AN02str TaxID=3423363 RepID=UPI003D322F62